METMIEKVEKAIAALAEDDVGCNSDRCWCSGVEAFECKSGRKVADIARAAIEAMTEPTEFMHASPRNGAQLTREVSVQLPAVPVLGLASEARWPRDPNKRNRTARGAR